MTSKAKSRRPDRRDASNILPHPSADDIPDFVRERAFQAVADYFERLHRQPFTISQAVSIARALRPYVEREGRRRQAHGATAPGRRGKAKPGFRFSSREFVARCVGLSPATLRKAEAVIEAAERDPRFRRHVLSMDFQFRSGRAFRALTDPALSLRVWNAGPKPAGREFGERLVGELMRNTFGRLTIRKRKRSARKVLP